MCSGEGEVVLARSCRCLRVDMRLEGLPDTHLQLDYHLNYIRGLLSSGFASLNHPRDWSLSHVHSPGLRKEFERITEGMEDALGFTHTISVGLERARRAAAEAYSARSTFTPGEHT